MRRGVTKANDRRAPALLLSLATAFTPTACATGEGPTHRIESGDPASAPEPSAPDALTGRTRTDDVFSPTAGDAVLPPGTPDTARPTASDTGPATPPEDLGPDLPRDAGPPPPNLGRPSDGRGGAFPGTQPRSTEGVDFVVHVPPAYDPSRPLPLVGLFHGQGGDAPGITEFFAAASDAGPFLTVAVTASGQSGGWVGGQDVQRFSLALNDALTAWNVDLDRLYLWGFSAGAHFVHGIALDNADNFAGYAVVAGALDQYAGTDAPGAARRPIPVMVHIGRGDPLYGHATADRAVFTSAGWIDGQTYRLVEFDGGHELRPEHPADAWMFLRGFSL